MTTLFSYVVDHDFGFAPNPASGYCTLVHCKFKNATGRRNIVELAMPDDWIIGTGGHSKDSAGPGRIIYLMRVDEKLAFDEFLSDRRFHGRLDRLDQGEGNEFALISRKYFYFGRNALTISELPPNLRVNLAKRGPGFRKDYSAAKLKQLVTWFERHCEAGITGQRCGGESDSLATCER